MGTLEKRSEGGRVNEPEEDPRGKEHDLSQFARGRPPDPPDKGGSLMRGCAIAIGITLLMLAFVVGACFIGMS
jgi:hypothetical protein